MSFDFNWQIFLFYKRRQAVFEYKSKLFFLSKAFYYLKNNINFKRALKKKKILICKNLYSVYKIFCSKL